jgi:hypothetical protein
MREDGQYESVLAEFAPRAAEKRATCGHADTRIAGIALARHVVE